MRTALPRTSCGFRVQGCRRNEVGAETVWLLVHVDGELIGKQVCGRPKELVSICWQRAEPILEGV
ncbi:MAG: hypothetical protein ACUVX9_09375 [Anaerolineae bacterium]